MFKSKIEKFIVKRVLIIFTILAMLNIVFLKQKWPVLFGFALGTAFSLLRFAYMAFIFSKIFIGKGRTGAGGRLILKYILNQVSLLFFLAASLKFNQWFFWGAMSGILLVPFVLFINSLTEGLGISHNNFE